MCCSIIATLRAFCSMLSLRLRQITMRKSAVADSAKNYNVIFRHGASFSGPTTCMSLCGWRCLCGTIEKSIDSEWVGGIQKRLVVTAPVCTGGSELMSLKQKIRMIQRKTLSICNRISIVIFRLFHLLSETLLSAIHAFFPMDCAKRVHAAISR